jgi:light-regulated signal transduction histidine kinase (bacteriophytochrome)
MMGQLIDDLINFSKLGTKENVTETINMKNLASSCVVKLLEHAPREKYRVEIKDIPPCCGDPALLHQVWMNLIGNSIKYSSNKEAPCIEIGFTQNRQQNVYYIKDNGEGFDMRYADKLFGVFQRLHNKSEFEGTGIGLALVKRIINRHNGDIWAEATPGEGATFYFYLPDVLENEFHKSKNPVQYEYS